jgi:hypothetical protein
MIINPSSQLYNSLSIFAWYNWRAIQDAPPVELLYIILFAAVVWLVIQVIDRIAKKFKRK